MDNSNLKIQQMQDSLEQYFSLDLSTFKTQPCTNQVSHNPKHCEFYHSISDQISVDSYKQPISSCLSRVSQLYHPQQYKKKLCVSLDCEYSLFCSFAHSENELRLEKLHLYERNSDFFLFLYKTVECPFMHQHNRKTCVYYHNPQDQRRIGRYSKEECPKWNKFEKILKYDESGCHLYCDKSHGWKERDFHLQVFKVRKCKGECQDQQDCPFWHNANDRRKGSSKEEIRKWNSLNIKQKQCSINFSNENIINNNLINNQKFDYQTINQDQSDFQFQLNLENFFQNNSGQLIYNNQTSKKIENLISRNNINDSMDNLIKPDNQKSIIIRLESPFKDSQTTNDDDIYQDFTIDDQKKEWKNSLDALDVIISQSTLKMRSLSFFQEI